MHVSVKVGRHLAKHPIPMLMLRSTENDTLARIGTACFQQLLENNVRKLSPEKWERVVSAFVQLFKTTTAHQLFDEALRSEKEAPPIENGSSSADGAW